MWGVFEHFRVPSDLIFEIIVNCLQSIIERVMLHNYQQEKSLFSFYFGCGKGKKALSGEHLSGFLPLVLLSQSTFYLS